MCKYNELEGEGKEKAMNEHFEFLNEVGDLEGGCTFKEKVEIVMESLKINDYLFFKNGDMADITHYTGKHKKSGTTELKFNNEVYIL